MVSPLLLSQPPMTPPEESFQLSVSRKPWEELQYTHHYYTGSQIPILHQGLYNGDHNPHLFRHQQVDEKTDGEGESKKKKNRSGEKIDIEIDDSSGYEGQFQKVITTVLRTLLCHFNYNLKNSQKSNRYTMQFIYVKL